MNLATHPFESRRRFYVLAGAAGIFLLLAAAVLGGTVARNFRSERGLSRQISTLRTELDKFDKEQKRLDEFLQRSDVIDLMDRSEFLNALIGQKAISWTRIFMDLEKLPMPDRVQVVAIRPVLREAAREGPRDFSKNKARSNIVNFAGPLEMDLQMIVSGENVGQLLELLRRMQKSGNFHQPVLRQENPPQAANKTDNLYELQLSVLYAQN